MRANHDVDVKWLAFPLHPETPDEGVSLEELFKGRDLDVDKMLRHLSPCPCVGVSPVSVGRLQRDYCITVVEFTPAIARKLVATGILAMRQKLKD